MTRQNSDFGRSEKADRRNRRAVVQFASLEARLLMSGDWLDCEDHAGEAHGTPTPEFDAIHEEVRELNRILAADTATGGAGTFEAAVAVAGGVPILNSNPSAPVKLYLDFDGDAATTWGSYSVPATPAYDRDGDPSTFSEAEVAAITSIWARVAEKYSPFNINVTTVDPGALVDRVSLRVVIGGNGAWTGGSYGGVAYTGGFYTSSSNTVYCFEDNLGNGDPRYVAESAAHEAGHAFGLKHQSQYDAAGSLLATYYRGDSQRAPIMGTSYYATRGLWWKGTTSSATTIQDDLAVLAGSNNGFGYRADDHGNTIASASTLSLSGGSLSSAGIITTTADLDYFAFTTAGGSVTFTANVAAQGAMLDLRLELRDARGNLLASADTGSLGETLSASVAAGTYYVVVASHGGYGDVGQYFLTGTVSLPQGFVAAPTGLAASATASSVSLAWADRSDGEDGFLVQRSADGGASWQTVASVPSNATAWTDLNIVAGGSYAYRVQAFKANYKSDFSNVVAVTPVPAAPSSLTASALSSSVIRLSWSDVSGERGFRVERSADGVSGWTTVATTAAGVTSYDDSGLPASTTFHYRVRAIGDGGNSAPGPVASARTAALVAPAVPAAPTGLSVTLLTKNKAQIAWTDAATNETGFILQRSTDGKTWSTIATLGANVTTFQNNGLKRDTTYHYRVAAVNAVGQSAFSMVASATAGQSFAEAVPPPPAAGLFSTNPVAQAKGGHAGRASDVLV